jgi:hypothetical protein
VRAPALGCGRDLSQGEFARGELDVPVPYPGSPPQYVEHGLARAELVLLSRASLPETRADTRQELLETESAMVLSFLLVTTFHRSCAFDTVAAAEWAVPRAHFWTAAVSTRSTAGHAAGPRRRSIR